MVNVSSVGASLKGGFYLKTKAEMENGTQEFFPKHGFPFQAGFTCRETGKNSDWLRRLLLLR